MVRDGHTTLYALRDRRLEFYWSDDDERFALSGSKVSGLDFLVLHEQDYALVADQLRGYDVQASHPMLCERQEPPELPRVDNVLVADVDTEQEDQLVAIARMLNRCYPGHRHTAEEIARWRDLPAFDRTLWFWLRDAAGGEPLALAISTYQPSVRETYLDWIQVAPPARGRGLGSLLVTETLRRALPKSDIVRVTGVADDFYRACGFVGTETWYIASRAGE